MDSNSKNKIRLEITNDEGRFIDNTRKLSERSFATLIVKPKLNMKEQIEIVKKFNDYIENKR